jgi:DNA mismatch repair protein MutL
MPILILDQLTAEKIAAGEVIENPASVVKELVENALDAGATRIEIEIDGGGIDKILVTDNGHGLSGTEISLAFKRFATSKLQRIDDLEQLTSLGFRGEALPSIAAVARVEMTSRTESSLSGVKICLSGGQVIDETETGAPYGTTVKVQDLFYNTPGRRKFLRAPAVEAARISYLINEQVLAYPQVAFTLKSSGRNIIKTSGDGVLLHAIGSLYGSNIANAMVELEDPSKTIDRLSISGCLSLPHLNRASKRWITLIVNNRLVKNTMLVSAITRGYGELLPSRRFPYAVLNLQLEQNQIDVNVHPAKTEIRFLDPETVKKSVFNTVKLSLQRTDHITPWTLQNKDPEFLTKNDHFLQDEMMLENSAVYTPGEMFRSDQGLSLDSTYSTETEPVKIKNCKIIGQYLDSYIVIQKGEDLLLIDQHAAHERLLYNRLKSIDQEQISQSKVQLTIPYTLKFPRSWHDRIPEIIPFLSKKGIELELIGLDSYVVRAVPFLDKEQINDYELYDLVERLITSDNDDSDFQDDTLLKTIACHRSVKAKQKLDNMELRQLINDWSATDNSGYCPHGRPTVIVFKRSDLEKSFLRRGN